MGTFKVFPTTTLHRLWSVLGLARRVVRRAYDGYQQQSSPYTHEAQHLGFLQAVLLLLVATSAPDMATHATSHLRTSANCLSQWVPRSSYAPRQLQDPTPHESHACSMCFTIFNLHSFHIEIVLGQAWSDRSIIVRSPTSSQRPAALSRASVQIVRCTRHYVAHTRLYTDANNATPHRRLP